MHQAALLGEGIKDAREFGWEVKEILTQAFVYLFGALARLLHSCFMSAVGYQPAYTTDPNNT